MSRGDGGGDQKGERWNPAAELDDSQTAVGFGEGHVG